MDKYIGFDIDSNKKSRVFFVRTTASKIHHQLQYAFLLASPKEPTNPSHSTYQWSFCIETVAGKTLDAGSFWFGLIDEIRIYDRTIKP